FAPKRPPLPATAKSVIHLFMQGGPSHVDTFDPKPVLSKLDGQHPPASFGNADFMDGQLQTSVLLASKRTFQKRGQSGLEVSDLAARMRSYELAFRMQISAPEATDISGESEATRKLYGLDNPVSADFGGRCLLARRLVERGVRFVQVWSGNGQNADDWDGHIE